MAKLTLGNVAIELLDRYQLDLSCFEAQKLDELAQTIVIGRQCLIHTSLRMSKWPGRVPRDVRAEAEQSACAYLRRRARCSPWV